MTEFCIKIYRFFRNHRAVFWVSMIAYMPSSDILPQKYIWKKTSTN